MENLKIEKTEYTPKIFLQTNGLLYFEGRSYSENTFSFYKPVKRWLNEYFNGNAQEETKIGFELTYFNSRSAKTLFEIFEIFEKNKEKNKITISWIYDKEDESSKEDGEHFAKYFNTLDINLIEK